MSIYISPDEIVAEIRRIYPTDKVTKTVPRPEPPRITFANEYLYAVPIYIYGEGVRGQYLRHTVFERDGKRYWGIEYGWVTLYGETSDKHIVPLVVMGLPTRFVFSYRPNEFVRFIIDEVPVDYLECREDQIINLERVMSGRDPIMIIDKYDILRSGAGAVPPDLIDRVMEYHAIIEQLQRALAQYEKSINDYRTTIRVLEARIAKYQELLRFYEERIVKLSTEVTSIQAELIRLKDEMAVRSTEVTAAEEAMKKLMDVVDRLRDIVSELAELRTVAKEGERK